MKLCILLLALYIIALNGFGQGKPDSTIGIAGILQNLYVSDSTFKKMIDEIDIDCKSVYNDSVLIGKFSLCLSKAGKSWFNVFTALKFRVHFYQNWSDDSITNFETYYENEILNLDYDSVTYRFDNEEDFLFDDGRVCEMRDYDVYTFFKNKKKLKTIRLSFLGGRELKSFHDVKFSKQKKELWERLDNGDIQIRYFEENIE